MHRVSRLVLILLCVGVLAACGNKGPLVLPDTKPRSAAAAEVDRLH